MKNIIDYVENELSTMDEKQFNPVDSLILSQVAYFELEGLVGGLNPRKANIRFIDLLKSENFDRMLGSLIYPKLNKDLLFALACSPRFRNIQINFFEKKLDINTEKQFAAITYILDKHTAYIAFRGTDDSIIGWKEDFNMAFLSPIPSHIEGVNYVNKISKLLKHNLYIGGHSKGGNIAVYSAMNCKQIIFPRIIQVFSHDGPGFRNEVIECPNFYKIKNKIHKTIPYSSIVGMILEYHEDYNVVNSRGLSIFQHNPFKWEIVDRDFNYVKDVSAYSKHFNKTFNKWLNNISDDKRKLFIDSLFQVLTSTNVDGFSQLIDDWKLNIPIILDSLKNLDPEIKSMIIQLLKELRNIYIKDLYPFENLTKIKFPKKSIVTRKLILKSYSNKKNYCTLKIKNTNNKQ